MQRAVLKRIAGTIDRSWLGRRPTSRFLHASAPLPATHCATDRWPPSRTHVPEVDEVSFPREGPGLSYALNWALAARGIPPCGEAYQNLKQEDLTEEHSAWFPDPTTVTTIYACGAFSSGATTMSMDQFNRILTEVTSHLAAVPTLYVHNGSIGAPPSLDMKMCAVCDDPSSALVLASILNQTPKTGVSLEPCSLMIYVASRYSSLPDKELDHIIDTEQGFVAVNYDLSTLILGGKAFTDISTVKSVLCALSAPAFLSRQALPLAARLLVQGESTILVFVSEEVLDGKQGLLKAAVSSDLGIVWSTEGVARLFSSGEPNLFKNPSSLVLVTLDSSGAVPEIAKLTPTQAALQFLAGLSEDKFNPGYQSGPASVSPISLAACLYSKLSQTSIPAFVVNASLLSEDEIIGLMEATVSEKLPKSKNKKPSELAVEVRKRKYTEYISQTFPDLPEELKISFEDKAIPRRIQI